jgi:hypothetical protein
MFENILVFFLAPPAEKRPKVRKSKEKNVGKDLDHVLQARITGPSYERVDRERNAPRVVCA